MKINQKIFIEKLEAFFNWLTNKIFSKPKEEESLPDPYTAKFKSIEESKLLNMNLEKEKEKVFSKVVGATNPKVKNKKNWKIKITL